MLGLIVPKAYGGMGGTLRDLCGGDIRDRVGLPCDGAGVFLSLGMFRARGLLALDALRLAVQRAESPGVRRCRGKGGVHEWAATQWLANFATRSVKLERSAINDRPRDVNAGMAYLLSGVKSVRAPGCGGPVPFVTREAGGYRPRTSCTFFGPNATRSGVASARSERVGSADRTHGSSL